MGYRCWQRTVQGKWWTPCVVGVLGTVVLLVLFMVFPGMSQAECSDIPTVEELKRGSKVREGFYYNCRFYYGVSIPQGFVGMSVEPPAPQHGFVIVDSRYPSGAIWVSGEHNGFDDITSNDDLADVYLRWLENEGLRIISVQKDPATLDELPALRLIVRSQCPDGRLLVDDRVFTLQSGIEYSIHLRVEAASYTEHVRILEDLVSSWQFRGQWCEVFCGDSYPLSAPEKWDSYESLKRNHQGEYSNCYYGYAVTIPKGFTGKSDYPTHVMEGFGILVSHQGYLRVEGGPNRFHWRSLEHVTKAYETWISTAAHRVLAVQQESVTLGGLPALRLIARYECPAGTLMVKDLFFAFRDEHTMYRLELLAAEEKYEEYKPILEQIVTTFQLTDVLHKECQEKNDKP